MDRIEPMDVGPVALPSLSKLNELRKWLHKRILLYNSKVSWQRADIGHAMHKVNSNKLGGRHAINKTPCATHLIVEKN